MTIPVEAPVPEKKQSIWGFIATAFFAGFFREPLVGSGSRDPNWSYNEEEQRFINRWGYSGAACGGNPYKSNLYAGLAPKYGGYEPGDFEGQ